MPRYYFNFSDRPDFVDADGVELAGIDAARDEAIHTCGEILRDYGKTRDELDWTMVVTNESGAAVLTLAFQTVESRPDL